MFIWTLFLTLLPLVQLLTSRNCLLKGNQTLNLQHETRTNNTCILCLPQCRTCSSSNDTTCASGNCQLMYYYDTNSTSCKQCPSLCEECNNATCTKCIASYYLTSNTCKPCPQGASKCSSSSVLSCSLGYFYDTQAYSCRKCQANCQSCTNPSKCVACSPSFILNTNSTYCLSCGVTQCLVCSSVGTCSKCSNGFKVSSGKCLKMTCMEGCFQCTNLTTCLGCKDGYFLIDGVCAYGGSILCNLTLTPAYVLQSYNSTLTNTLADYGSCKSCSGLAKSVDTAPTFCLPLVGMNPTTKTKYTAFSQNVICSMPYLSVSSPASPLLHRTDIGNAYLINMILVVVVMGADSTGVLKIQLSLGANLISSKAETHALICNPSQSNTSISKYQLTYRVYPTQDNLTHTLDPLQISLTPSSSSASVSIKQLYIVSSLCLKSQCLQCSSPNTCIKCMNKYFLQDSQCVISCGVGYYSNEEAMTCVDKCKDGKYNGDQGKCMNCPQECELCSSVSTCTKCKANYFLSPQGKCSSNCSDTPKSYPQSSTRLCTPCHNPCLTCLSNIKCTSCLVGYYLEQGNTCVLQCPSGYYQRVVSANPQCSLCDSSCLDCEIEATMCTRCKNPLLLENGHCVNTCINGYYGHQGRCISCVSPCLTCLSADACTSCKSGLLLSGRNICVNTCPSNFYLQTSSSTCQQCPSLCSTCLSFMCLSCISPSLLCNGKCIQQCPSTLTSSLSCDPCPFPCELCSGNSTNYQCHFCQTGFYLHNATCTYQCPIGLFPNQTNRQCQACAQECQQCGVNSTCYRCKVGYVLLQATCVPNCPNGMYDSNSTCSECSANCLTCSSSPNNCTSCPSGTLSLLSQCLQNCPSTHVPIQNACIECAAPCLTCITSVNTCTSCTINSFSIVMNSQTLCLTQSQCENRQGYYPETVTWMCLPCESPCLKCSSSTVCLNCQDTYILFKNICLGQCPLGYYPSNNSCSLCPSQCLQCTSSTSCQICKPNFLFSSGSCLASCPQNYYPSTSATCQLCIQPCLSCLHSQYCTSCVSTDHLGSQISYILFFGQCLTECEQGFYKNETKCEDCPLGCSSCTAPDKCESCLHNFYLLQNTCIAFGQCPIGKYPDAILNQCSLCQPPCLTCSSKYTCLTCIAPLIFKNNECLSACPVSTYPSSTICQNCPNLCSKCTSSTNCSTCLQQAYLVTNANGTLCAKECPDGMYKNEGRGTCEQCGDHCESCLSLSNCSKCSANRKLQEFVCVEHCSAFYYQSKVIKNGEDVASCLKCNKSCSNCSSYEVCHSCSSSYLVVTFNTTLINQTVYNISFCSEKCPLGTYLSEQTLHCQSCQQGCQLCTTDITCTSCFADGYVLHSVKCLSDGCPSGMYIDVSQNRCVERLQCESKAYLVDEQQMKCYKNKCPTGVLLLNNLCIRQCPSGYFANFDLLCVKNVNTIEEFEFQTGAIPKDGYIELIININTQISQAWNSMFTGIDIEPKIDWIAKSKLSNRLLSQLSYRVVPQVSPHKNVLILRLVFTSPILTPTDMHIQTYINNPYTSQISVSGFPLQNTYANSTVSMYMITQEQIDYYSMKSPKAEVFSIMLLIIVFGLTCLNFWHSNKNYLMVSTWDFMQILYVLSYLPVYWPLAMRTFLRSFQITWLKWFTISLDYLVYSSPKTYANVTDMHLFRNIFSNLIIVCAIAFIFGILKLAKKVHRIMNKQNDKNRSITQKGSPKQSECQRLLQIWSKFILKLLLGSIYLCITNLFYFSLSNIFFEHEDYVNPVTVWYVVSIIIALAIPFCLVYAFYKQINHNFIDAGLHPHKKTIILCLPIYIVVRKLFIIFFIALYFNDAGFGVCFGFIVTMFISILVWWFQPYNNKVRYFCTLAVEAGLFVFLLLTFVYVANQKEMMTGGFASFLIFIAGIVIIGNLIYPSYHIFVLLDLKQRILNVFKSQQSSPQTQTNTIQFSPQCIEQPVNKHKQTKHSQVQDDDQEKDSDEAPHQLKMDSTLSQDSVSCFNTFKANENGKNGSKNKKQHQTSEKAQKKKKIKLPKATLIPGQTDYEADKSSQEGQRNKMTLADYTIRLAKREIPVIRQLKNYDINENEDSEEDDKQLAQKGQELAQKIEKRKEMVRRQMMFQQERQ